MGLLVPPVELFDRDSISYQQTMINRSKTMVNEKMLMGRDDLLEESRKTQKVRIAWRHSKLELAEHINREKELSGHGEWFDYSEIAILEAWIRRMNKEHDDIFYYLQFCEKTSTAPESNMEPIELDARYVAYLSLYMFMVAVLVITHSVAVLLVVIFLARALYLSSNKQSVARIIVSRSGVKSYVGNSIYWEVGNV
jgi:hypothetical protein